MAGYYFGLFGENLIKAKPNQTNSVWWISSVWLVRFCLVNQINPFRFGWFTVRFNFTLELYHIIIGFSITLISVQYIIHIFGISIPIHNRQRKQFGTINKKRMRINISTTISPHLHFSDQNPALSFETNEADNMLWTMPSAVRLTKWKEQGEEEIVE